MTLENLRYPVGRFMPKSNPTTTDFEEWISIIANFPQQMHDAVSSLSDTELEWPYRSDGWTIRQVVHHCADSHINSIVRFKLALTEDNPTIKGYEEARWAELTDAKTMPVASSLALLQGLHARWVVVLQNMETTGFERTLSHPEWKKDLSLAFMLDLYQWHCRHHLAHVGLAKKFKGVMPEVG